MLENIQGIVLRTVKYGDSSIIVDTFTESRGRVSFATNLSRNKRSNSSSAFWMLLSQVNFQADIRPTVKLSKPRDVRFYYNYIDLPYNPIKTSIAMFISEFLCSALRGEGENVPLYKYIEMSLRWLDMADSSSNSGVANFHLVFLMRMTRFIGIYPNLEGGDDVFDRRRDVRNMYFDLLAGEYTRCQPSHPHFLRPEEASKMPLLFRMDYSTMHVYKFNRQQRKRCLDILLQYYSLHVPQFPTLKSLDVLSELFT
jgi:DNA repair protein RecO (recombination protein O)